MSFLLLALLGCNDDDLSTLQATVDAQADTLAAQDETNIALQARLDAAEAALTTWQSTAPVTEEYHLGDLTTRWCG